MEWINRFFKRLNKGAHPAGAQALSPSKAEMMLKMIQKTQEVELSGYVVSGVFCRLRRQKNSPKHHIRIFYVNSR
jgi:hypothetical protein